MRAESWFVVLTYYPDKKRIASLVQNLGSHVVVVDNTPDPDTKKYVRTEIVFTGENLGYAGGMNRGIKYCFHRGAQWVVLINDDLSLSSDSVSQLVAKLSKIGPGVAGPFVGSFDSRRWTTMVPAKGSVDYISGSCIAIHREVFESVGNFYEPYFMYYEDADLSVRARNAGFSLYHIPLPLDMRHRDKGNEYYLARNHLLFVERNAPISVKIHEFARLLKTFYEHRRHGNIGAEQGVRDYMLRRFGRRDT